MRTSKKQVDEALAKVDFEEFEKKLKDVRISKEEMEKLKKEMEQLKIELKNEKFDINIDKQKINKEVQEELKNAKEEMKKARGEMAETKALMNKLTYDGLIDTKKPYSIEIKEGELFINGTKQSKEVNEKYKEFLKKRPFTIKNDDGTGDVI